ncbi:hypothetical protein RERY_41310 [Rhodococcus erythropolis]|jgi:hypothetical protein|nr:hypothetical protein [Rhodococcus erythropolis]OFV75283.1 hypothetical protein RERY_41310 [Rhodococcus erythropolis]
MKLRVPSSRSGLRCDNVSAGFESHSTSTKMSADELLQVQHLLNLLYCL